MVSAAVMQRPYETWNEDQSLPESSGPETGQFDINAGRGCASCSPVAIPQHPDCAGGARVRWTAVIGVNGPSQGSQLCGSYRRTIFGGHKNTALASGRRLIYQALCFCT
jgi:hypothetical protein